ncbi:MAG: hypothetical protein CVU71_09265 [Deltaproteobacteria bacterium HGW-Deltaproteobacteria-6]|nr:MAG: hypothetical protein CVU71_09265 [Deltaproteobacteria bacterium HGW-Deltaproteobacteria-6]
MYSILIDQKFPEKASTKYVPSGITNRCLFACLKHLKKQMSVKTPEVISLKTFCIRTCVLAMILVKKMV